MKAKEATTIQYQKDNDGNYLLDENGEKIPVVRLTMWNNTTGEPQEIYALDAEQIDQIRELIETTTKAADYNDSIFNIVNEQAAAFLKARRPPRMLHASSRARPTSTSTNSADKVIP